MILAPLLGGLTLYVSGLAAQLLINYNAWQEQGGELGSGIPPELPDPALLACLRAVFHWPEGLVSVAVCLIVLAVVFIFVFRVGRDGAGTYDSDRRLTYADSGSYGTAHFMSEREMRGVLEKKSVESTDGIILGKMGKDVVSLPVDSRLNKHMAIIGSSGSMKSRAMIRNLLLQAVRRGESAIVTDPKSEIYADMAVYLKNQGYTVKVLNFVDPEHSDSWNCLLEVGDDEQMAQTLCDTIIKNTSGGKGDHFWDTAELNLLKALVLYVSLSYKPERRNIGEVYNLICSKSEAQLSKMIETLPQGHPAKTPYHIFHQASETIRTSIVIGLGSRLQLFQSKLVREITSHNEIDLELPAKEKCVYFCIIDDQSTAFDFLSSLFFSFLFIRLTRYADQHGPGGRCNIPVNLLLDEHPNCGLILDFNKKVSVCRSRDLIVVLACQSVGQLANRYPNDVWQEILGNCDTQICMGCSDAMTARFLSERTGEVTIGVQSTSKQLSSWQVSTYTPQYRQTSSVGRRQLMTMDEVLRMPVDEALVIIRGQNVLKLKKFDYTLHPEAGKLVKCRASDHIPQWRAAQMQAATTQKAPQEAVTVPNPEPTPAAPTPARSYRKMD